MLFVFCQIIGKYTVHAYFLKSCFILYHQILSLKAVLLGIVESNVESSERGRESFFVSSGTSGAASSRDSLLLDPHARGQQLSASSFSTEDAPKLGIYKL